MPGAQKFYSDVEIKSGKISVNTATPIANYIGDFRGTSTALQMHIASSDADSGLYIGSTSANGTAIATGVTYNGTNWINKATTGSILVKTGSAFNFYLSSGTVGATATLNNFLNLDANGISYTGTGSSDTVVVGSIFTLPHIAFGVGGVAGNSGTMTIFHYLDSFHLSKYINLGAVSAKTHIGDVNSAAVGDKIGLYGSATASTRFGFGIQAATLVAYVPSACNFAVRQTAASGQASSGSDAFTISNAGLARGADGTAALPTFGFITDPNTGMYSDAADALKFSTNGTLRFTIGTSTIDVATMRITGVVNPVNAQDVATKDYVDSVGGSGGTVRSFVYDDINDEYDEDTDVRIFIGEGDPVTTTGGRNQPFDLWFSSDGLTGGGNVPAKLPVRVATTAAGTLASSFENGDTVDGVVLATGNRILIKNQAAPAENGIYTVNATGAPTRATDADAVAEVARGTTVTAQEGTANTGTLWVITATIVTLGTTAFTWAQIGAGGAISYPLTGTDGSAAAPTYSFASDAGNGMYLSTTDTLGFTTNGVLRLSISTTAVTQTLPSLGPNGTAGAPAYSFSGDPNTGIYQTGTADTLGISTNGVVRVTINTASVTQTLPNLGPNGTAAAPTYSFSGDPNTGIYQTGTADTIGVSTNGVVRLTLNTASLTSTLPYVAPLGAVGTPSFTFAGDLNTGMYSPGADQVALSAGGVLGVTVSATTTDIARQLTIDGNFDVEAMYWMTVAP